jgi:hypothetical protein
MDHLSDVQNWTTRFTDVARAALLEADPEVSTVSTFYRFHTTPLTTEEVAALQQDPDTVSLGIDTPMERFLAALSSNPSTTTAYVLVIVLSTIVVYLCVCSCRKRPQAPSLTPDLQNRANSAIAGNDGSLTFYAPYRDNYLTRASTSTPFSPPPPRMASFTSHLDFQPNPPPPFLDDRTGTFVARPLMAVRPLSLIDEETEDAEISAAMENNLHLESPEAAGGEIAALQGMVNALGGSDEEMYEGHDLFIMEHLNSEM